MGKKTSNYSVKFSLVSVQPDLHSNEPIKLKRPNYKLKAGAVFFFLPIISRTLHESDFPSRDQISVLWFRHLLFVLDWVNTPPQTDM